MHCANNGKCLQRAMLACDWFSAEAFLLEVLITNRMLRVVFIILAKVPAVDAVG